MNVNLGPVIFKASTPMEDVGTAFNYIQPLGRVVVLNHPRKDESFKINQRIKKINVLDLV